MLASPEVTGGRSMSSDTTASRWRRNGGRAPGAEAAEHERQFREMLEFCPAALLVVDEDGRLLFHNARLRELLGYQQGRARAASTPALFWHDLEQRARIIAVAARDGRPAHQRTGDLADQERPAASPAAVLRAGRLSRRTHQLRRRQARAVGLRHHRAHPARDAGRRAGAPASRNPGLLPGGGVRGRRGRAHPVPQSAAARPAGLRAARAGAVRHQAVLARPRSSRRASSSCCARAAANC